LIDRHINSLDIAEKLSADGVPPEIEIMEFVDNGYSGVNFERPGVQELLDLVRQSKIDCIVVKDFSRFGRNSIETGYFIEMVFPIFRTRFISISDGFDSDDYKEDTGGMQVAFKFLMHEYYSRDMSKKSKTAKYAKMKRGEYQSVICQYGYRKGANGRLEIDEEAAEVVRMIFEQALIKRNAQDIAKFLYEKNIPTPGEYRKLKGKPIHDVSRSGGIWQRSTILRFLEDERYTGTYIVGKRTVIEIGSTKSRLKPESEWFKIPNHHPAIINRELFDRVQKVTLRFKCPKTKTADFPLKSKVICGCCRHTMPIVPRKDRAFICRYTRVDENAECHQMEISEHELEVLLFNIINKHAQVILNTNRLGDSEWFSIRTEQQAEYEKRINSYKDEKCSLYEKYVLGDVGADAYKAEKAKIDGELARLVRAYDNLKAETTAMSAAKNTDDELRRLAETVVSAEMLSRPLVDMLIDKVFVYPGNRVEIVWKAAGFASTDNRKR